MPDRPGSSRLALPLFLVAAIAIAEAASATPTPGFLEHFPGTSVEGWTGGTAPTNPGTGGVGGVGDGYLLIKNQFAGNFGAYSPEPPYAGNWEAAGITQVRVWFNDVDTDDALEMHVGIGAAFSNFWQYNVGFIPPHNQWAEFIVDVSSGANWTRIIGAGTFSQALQGADRLLVRHDVAPYVQSPNPILAEVGLDRVLTTNATADVPTRGASVRRALLLAAPAPNPSHGTVTLGIQVFEPGNVRIEIVDVGGRIVRRDEVAATAPGSLNWSWDGRDDEGRSTAAGYYRVRAIGPSGGMSRGLLRVD